MAHQGGVAAVAFSPDGKAVLTGSDDRTARLWTVSTVTRRSPTRRRLGRGRHRPGARCDGFVHVLDNAAERQCRERLDREGGPPDLGKRGLLDPILFGPEPTARAGAWIERKRWAEAEAAFDEAVLARPFDADVVLERARFHASRSRPDKADADFVRALRLGSVDPNLIETLVRNEALFSRAVTLHRDPSRLWISRGDDRARRQRWAEAIADYEQAIRLQPENLMLRHGQILLLGAVGDLDQFEQARSDLVDRFRPTITWDTANNAAWFGSLALRVDVHLESLVRLAEWAVDRSPDAERKAVYLNTLGVALYRAGRFEDAIRRLDDGIELRNGTSIPQDWPFLAMAHHRLGHRDQARHYLQRLRSRQTNADPNRFWDELEIRVLQSEAEATILYDPVFPADPFVD